MSSNLVWQLFVALSIIASCEALMCLSCDHVAKPRDCGHIVTCGTNEECFTEKRTGSNLVSYYEMGCRPTSVCQSAGIIGKKRHESKPRSGRDLINCFQCCDTDNCNMNMCDAAPSNNLRCMKCSDVLNPKDCTEIEECSPDESCYVNAATNYVNYEVRMTMGCLGRLQCDALKRAFSNRCVDCCNNADFCNYNSCDNSTTTPTTVTTSTSRSTTASSTTSSSINAKPSVSVTLSPITHSFAIACRVTGHPAPTVMWTFVSDSTPTSGLPVGIQQLHQNNTHDLYVASYNPSVHNGRYVCLASNSEGIGTGEIHVP